jgi:hypothetical protein
VGSCPRGGGAPLPLPHFPAKILIFTDTSNNIITEIILWMFLIRHGWKDNTRPLGIGRAPNRDVNKLSSSLSSFQGHHLLEPQPPGSPCNHYGSISSMWPNHQCGLNVNDFSENLLLDHIINGFKFEFTKHNYSLFPLVLKETGRFKF